MCVCFNLSLLCLCPPLVIYRSSLLQSLMIACFCQLAFCIYFRDRLLSLAAALTSLQAIDPKSQPSPWRPPRTRTASFLEGSWGTPCAPDWRLLGVAFSPRRLTQIQNHCKKSNINPNNSLSSLLSLHKPPILCIILACSSPQRLDIGANGGYRWRARLLCLRDSLLCHWRR